MISTNDLYKEIAIIEDALKDEISEAMFFKHMLKAQVLNLKLLHNQRTNMVQIMKKIGAKTIDPKERKDDSEKE